MNPQDKDLVRLALPRLLLMLVAGAGVIVATLLMRSGALAGTEGGVAIFVLVLGQVYQIFSILTIHTWEHTPIYFFRTGLVLVGAGWMIVLLAPNFAGHQ